MKQMLPDTSMICLSGAYFVEVCDVVVIESGLQFHLFEQPTDFLVAVQSSPLEDFNCHRFACVVMLTDSQLRVLVAVDRVVREFVA